MNLAFVLLADDKRPKEGDVTKAFASYASGKQRVVPRTRSDAASDDPLEFELQPGGTAFVSGVPAPVPDGEADQAANFSVSALGTGWKLPTHKTHLMVVLMDDGNCPAVEAMSAFTSLVAAVAAASGSVGVYWGTAGVTHDVEFFKSVAKEPGIIPRIMLWCGVQTAVEADGRMGILSLGMKQFSLPDLYLRTRKSESKAALGFFFDMLGYLAEGGEPLPEGDTVGRTDKERLPVNYVPSPIDPNVQVWRVELP